MSLIFRINHYLLFVCVNPSEELFGFMKKMKLGFGVWNEEAIQYMHLDTHYLASTEFPLL